MSDLDFGFRIAQRATEYGVDGFSTPQIMAFALELKEAGILTDAGLCRDVRPITRGDFTGYLTELSGEKG